MNEKDFLRGMMLLSILSLMMTNQISLQSSLTPYKLIPIQSLIRMMQIFPIFFMIINSHSLYENIDEGYLCHSYADLSNPRK